MNKGLAPQVQHSAEQGDRAQRFLVARDRIVQRALSDHTPARRILFRRPENGRFRRALPFALVWGASTPCMGCG